MEKKVSATIKDISHYLRISPSTVSRALNNHPEVSAETRQRVLQAAQKLKYQPHAAAISLVKKQTSTIGVIIPNIVQPYYAIAVSGMEAMAQQYGYYLLTSQSGEQYERIGLSRQTLSYGMETKKNRKLLNGGACPV